MKMARHQNEDGLACFRQLDVIKIETSLLTIQGRSRVGGVYSPKGFDLVPMPRLIVGGAFGGGITLSRCAPMPIVFWKTLRIAAR